MQLPSVFQDHAPLNTLYTDVKSALEPTFLYQHAEQLTFRAVLHAAAWLSENVELHTPYSATETQGQTLCHSCNNGNTLCTSARPSPALPSTAQDWPSGPT